MIIIKRYKYKYIKIWLLFFILCDILSIPSDISIYLINPEHKIAVITAVYGNREGILRKTAKQNIPVDFYAFTDNCKIKNKGDWIVDCTPYHDLPETKSRIDNGSFINSFSNNRHPYNLYKYYKFQFYLIPQLQKYKYVMWLDAAFDITKKKSVQGLFSEFLIRNKPMIFYEGFYPTFQEDIYGCINRPGSRWTVTYLWGMWQPYQNVSKQVEYYKSQGFDLDYFKGKIPGEKNYWLSGFYILDMCNPVIIPFLDDWFMQNLNFTTQCQVALPYIAWKHNIIPGTINASIFKDKRIKWHKHNVK